MEFGGKKWIGFQRDLQIACVCENSFREIFFFIIIFFIKTRDSVFHQTVWVFYFIDESLLLICFAMMDTHP